MKKYVFQISENAAPERLFPLVKRMLPQLSQRALRVAFEKRDVKQNGQRMGMNDMALPGATVELYTPQEERLISILYEDEQIMVVDKPAGVSCQKDEKGGKTVTELAADALRRHCPDAPEPLLCHRLDNQTRGLLLLAKTSEAQAAMEEGFRQRLIHKQYLCLVKGAPKPEHQVLRGWLIKDAREARVRVLTHEAPGALTAVTEYTVLVPGECSLVQIDLHTGRTHQIRAQMAAMGHPLLGDDKYGDRAFNRAQKAKRLMLCAVSLSFSLPGKWSYLNALSLKLEPGFEEKG